MLIVVYLLLVLVAARGLVRLLFSTADSGERALLTAVTALGLLVFLPTSLGALGLLKRSWLLGFASVLAVTTWRSRRSEAERSNPWIRVREVFRWGPDAPALWISAGLAVVWSVWVVLAARMPSFGWDDYAYHVPFMIHVYQSGGLGPFPVSDSLVYINAYPKSIELIGASWVVLAGTHGWSELVQLLFLPGAGLAIFMLAREFGAKRPLAAVMAFVPLQVPMLVCQLKTVYVDVAYAALVCLLAWGLVASARGRMAGLFVSAVAGGILVGTKLTGVYLGVPAPTLAAVLLWRRERPRPAKAALVALLVVGAFMILGGHWLVRNALLYGNPLWPFIIKLGPVRLPGRIDPAITAAWHGPPSTFSPAKRWLIAWLERRTWWGVMYNGDSNFAGFGPLWLALFLPSGFLESVLSVRDSWRARRFDPRLWFLLALVAVYLLDPGRQYQRYTLWAPLLAAVVVAMVAQRLPAGFYRCLGFLWIVGLIWTAFNCSSFGYIDPVEARTLAAGSVPPARPFMVGDFMASLAPKIADSDIVMYTDDVLHVQSLWNERLANKVIGHGERQGPLAEAVRQTKASMVIGPRSRLESELTGFAGARVVDRDHGSDLELWRIYDR